MHKQVALLCLLVSGCSGNSVPDSPVAIDAVQKNISIWHGKIVTVDGWLGKCQGYECQIFVSQAAAMANPETQSYESSLRIGASDSFDRAAEELQFSRVLLKAQINKQCFDVGTCKDRADVLKPLSIAKWTANSDSSKKVDQ